MNIFKVTARAVKKRPFIMILTGLLMLVLAILNAFIPVMAIIIGIVNMTGGSIFESLLSVLQMLIDPGIIPTLLILLAVFILLASAIAGLLLPGYLLVVNDGIEKGDRRQGRQGGQGRQGLFSEGLKSNFFKFFFMTVKTTMITVFLAVFLIVAAVPAIIVTRSALTTKPDLMIGALFIDFVTVGVLFMCISFFRVYVYMWYLAALKGEKNPFISGKAVADRQFWRMFLSLLTFDVVFAAVIFLIYLSDSQIFRYAAGWTFTTAFFTTLAVYLVKTYRDSSQN